MNKIEKLKAMSKSNDYMFRCVEVICADKNVSEDTLILMFLEYGKEVREENDNAGWISTSNQKPTKYGRYEVYREKCNKQHYETWNGTGWASNNDGSITHFREIKKPYTI